MQTLRMPSQARCPRLPPPAAAALTPATSQDHSWASLPVEFRAVDDLPIDPRSWSRSEVSRWVSRAGGLADRFPMNGKALCLMTAEMFSARVPHAGAKLHQDFRKRLARALALQELVEKLQMAAKQ